MNNLAVIPRARSKRLSLCTHLYYGERFLSRWNSVRYALPVQAPCRLLARTKGRPPSPPATPGSSLLFPCFNICLCGLVLELVLALPVQSSCVHNSAIIPGFTGNGSARPCLPRASLAEVPTTFAAMRARFCVIPFASW